MIDRDYPDLASTVVAIERARKRRADYLAAGNTHDAAIQGRVLDRLARIRAAYEARAALS